MSLNRGNLAKYIVRPIGIRKFWKKYPKRQVKGLEHLAEATSVNIPVTFISSHSNSHDIDALDEVLEKYANQTPMYFMRDDLLVPGLEWAPKSWSKKVYDSFGIIPIDQKDKDPLKKQKEAIVLAQQRRELLVLYPGATRHFGAVNGLVQPAVSLYTRLIKSLGTPQLFVPTGITYEEASLEVKFAKPICIRQDTNTREVGEQVTETLCSLTCTDPTTLTPKYKVMEYIKEGRK